MTTRGFGIIGVALLLGGCAQAGYDFLDTVYGGRPQPAAANPGTINGVPVYDQGAYNPVAYDPAVVTQPVSEAVVYSDAVTTLPPASYGGPVVYNEPVLSTPGGAVAQPLPAQAAPAQVASLPLGNDPSAGALTITPYDELLAETAAGRIDTAALEVPEPRGMAPIIEEGETSIALSDPSYAAPAPAPAAPSGGGGIDYAALDAAVGDAAAQPAAPAGGGEDLYAALNPPPAPAPAPPSGGGGGGGGDLAGTSWRVVAIAGTLATGEADLHFDRGSGAAGGQGPCNVYGGNYSSSADGTLVFENLTATERACDALDEEEAYFAALGLAERYSITPGGDRLTLADAGGAPLVTLGAY